MEPIDQVSPELSEKRRIACEYQRQRRARKKQEKTCQQQITIELTPQEAAKMNKAGLDARVREGKCFPGEVSPGVDAATLSDALQVAREFGKLLRIEDIHSGESLLDFERRVYVSWVEQGGPFLIRKSQQLVPGWGADHWRSRGTFEQVWVPLPGSNKPISVGAV